MTDSSGGFWGAEAWMRLLRDGSIIAENLGTGRASRVRSALVLPFTDRRRMLGQPAGVFLGGAGMVDL